LLVGDELDRYSGRFNLDYDLFKFLKIGTQTQVTYYDKYGRNNPLGNASKISPLTKLHNPDGSLDLLPNDKHANPLLDEQPNTSESLTKTLRIFPTIYAELRPFKNHDFTARTNLAINWDNRSRGTFNSATSYTIVNGGATQSLASHQADDRKQINWQGILNYNKTLNENHSFILSELLPLVRSSPIKQKCFM
jgi:TonB-dependent starch-binding outer membrane protein SusC